jgi:acyl carrier protein
MTTTEKVHELILKVKKGTLAADALHSEASIRDDLQLDSLNLMELLVNTEECFKISISTEETESVKTVGEFVAFVDSRCSAP